MSETCFFVVFGSDAEERLARIVVESLRTFGGRLADSPVWAFALDPARAPHGLGGPAGVECVPLAVEERYRGYPFAAKAAACARAEEMASPNVQSIVRLGLDTLVVNPPQLLELGPSCDAAFRPVHHRNVGSPAHEPPDAYWAWIYRTLGVDEAPCTVESFVDGETLRPYLNTHCFALNPALGVAQAWWAHFKAMIDDEAFQAGPCRGALHRIFLHQAILSALVATMLPWQRVRILPPEYSFPLHLLGDMPPGRRAPTLNSLVTVAYEDAFPWGAIEVEEPLRAWLQARLPA